MAANARRNGIDMTKRNLFSGYHVIPTYNALFGDDKAFVHMYYSKSYRGHLNTLECHKAGEDSLFSDLKDFDFAEILRDKRTTSLWRLSIQSRSA